MYRYCKVLQVASLLYMATADRLQPGSEDDRRMITGTHCLRSLIAFTGMQVAIWAPIYASKLFGANAQPGDPQGLDAD